MNILHYLFSISKFILSQFYTILFGRKLLQENIWLVGEKKTEARDNGYHFFKYLRLNHPEIKAVYAISKDSVDRKKVADLGEVVDYEDIPGNLCLVVDTKEGQALLPFHEDLVLSLDEESKTLTMEVPSGLLHL